MHTTHLTSWLVVLISVNKNTRTSPSKHHLSGEKERSLSVRLLVSGTCTRSAEFLGLAASGIGDQQASIVVDENVLNFLFRSFIHIYKGEFVSSKSSEISE